MLSLIGSSYGQMHNAPSLQSALQNFTQFNIEILILTEGTNYGVSSLIGGFENSSRYKLIGINSIQNIFNEIPIEVKFFFYISKYYPQFETFLLR